MHGFWQGYFLALTDRRYAKTGVKVALIVGTVLVLINHGKAIVESNMSGERWIAAGFTYIVPYLVNVHGQYSAHSRD